MTTSKSGDRASEEKGVTLTRGEKKRTPTMLKALCRLVTKGLSVRRAAERLHVHRKTVEKWRRELPEFDEAILAAEAAFIEHQTETIKTAARKGAWTAAAFLLERRFPTEFSQPQIQLQQNIVQANSSFEDLTAMLKRAQTSPAAMQALQSMGGAIDVESEVQALPAPESDAT